MEPLDPATNVEERGYSKRRISSILKAPRKSTVFSDSKQQENEVEIAKPVEKRNSRRVSFAPANDVLLFAKDVKTGSPTRNPLQELMAATAAPAQNRVQVAVTDNRNQQIMGIENLLSAPLHASQQWNMVSCDDENDIGEKTVMFSTEDASMNMTCSHTIAIDSEILGAHQDHDISHTVGERRVPVEDVSAGHTATTTSALLTGQSNESSVGMTNISTTAPFVDIDFKNFLASLSKPSGSNTNRTTPLTERSSEEIKSKAQNANTDKENQIPQSASGSRNVGEQANRSVFCPEDDVSLGMNAAHAGHIPGVGDEDDDPFHCLFPTPDMYAHSDKRSAQMMERKLEKSCKSSGCIEQTGFASLSRSSNLSGNPELPRIKPVTAQSSNQSINADSFLLQHKAAEVDPCNKGRPINASRSCGEPFNKGLAWPEDDISMDMTEVQTGCIQGVTGSSNSFQFLSFPQDSHPACDGIKTTDRASGHQSSEGLGSSYHIGLEKSLKPSQPQKQQEKLVTEDAPGMEKQVFSDDDVFMDLTKTHTGNIDPGFRFKLHQSVDLSPTPREQTLRLTADDDTAMDMTQCLTENYISHSVTSVRKLVAKTFDPPHNRSLLSRSLNTGYNNQLTSDCSVNPVTAQIAASATQSSGFTIRPEDDVILDMPEAQAGHIKDVHQTNDCFQSLFPSKGTQPPSFNIKKAMTSHQQSTDDHQPSSFKETSMKTSLKTMQRHQVKFDSEDHHREKTLRFTSEDAGMDVTQSHMVNIISDLLPNSFPNVDLPAHGEKTVRFTINDAAMDVTQSHTVNIVSGLNTPPYPKMDLFSKNEEKTVRFTAADAGMDVTQSHTANIISDLQPHSFPNVDLPANGEKTVRFTTNDAAMDVTQSHTMNIVTNLSAVPHPRMNLSENGEKTVRFTAADAAMDVTQSHTMNIVSDLSAVPHQKMNLSANGEKTVRFTPDDAAMDVTRSHTMNIVTNLSAVPHPRMNLSANGEKTVRFTAADAAMDVTQSHTMNIVSDLSAVPHQKMNLSANGEKTVRFTPDDAAMDVTRSHTVNISTDLNKLSHQHINLLPANEEKTERFTTKVLMDATKSHTVNISTNSEPKLHKNVDFQPTTGDKTMRFTTSDAHMDMTCFTVNIASNVASDLVLPDQNIQPMNEPMDVPLAVKKTNSSDCAPHSNWSSSAQIEEKCENPMTQEAEVTDTPSPQETADLYNFQLKTQKPDTNAKTESPSLISAVLEKPVMETMTNCAKISANMDTTEPQTGCLRQTSTDNLNHNVLSTQDDNSGHLKKSELLSQNSEALGSSTSGQVETKNLNSFDSDKMETVTEDQQRTEAFPSSEKMKAGAEEQDVDAHRSRTSRRLSLADLQSKVRRLSHIIKAAPDNVALDPSTAPLPPLDPDLDRNSSNKTTPLPALQSEPEMILKTENTEAQRVANAEQPSATTSFSLKTQRLMSRLSMGSFKPKLPQRTSHKESNELASAGKATRTLGVTSLLGKFDDVDDINDEELGGCEDMSETLDISIPEKSFEKENPSKGISVLKPLDESALKEFCSPDHGQKRPLQEDESYKDDEKRLKACTEHIETAFEPNIECGGNIATTTQTIDFSRSSHTGSRCDAAFESTNKHSLFESQLEEWSNDAPKKLEDGTITVHEFFKLFNIDFVIHNPRQSILPGRFLSDTDATPLDLLKDRHISRPKQMVYEADVQTLKEKVEGLKVRMQDLDKPLRVVNGPLWQEVMHFSKNEIKAFGAKLKERVGFFRKLGKHQSHAMKEELYSKLVQINREEQQKLRGKLEEADEMKKRLDDCICELEAELFSVEENGSGDKPSLKSLQEELSKVTEALANGDRKISELEMEKKQNTSKLNRLKAEAGSLGSNINMLNMVNEWRLGEKKGDFTSYTFLHETMLLQLMYEKSDGNDADDGSERNLANITFKFDLDDEKSQSHARLVHKLVSQHIEGESAWVEKYPTSKNVPKLLHDVSLVVSRCRLLGEELRLLKMWGGVKFDILDISCMDTRVHITFSSLRSFSKFEVVFGVGLINKRILFEVQSFKNVIGNTSIQQIEEIVASLTPGKKLFTKIVKKIHNALLC